MDHVRSQEDASKLPRLLCMIYRSVIIAFTEVLLCKMSNVVCWTAFIHDGGLVTKACGVDQSDVEFLSK